MMKAKRQKTLSLMGTMMVAGLLGFGSSVAADPVFGVWQTEPGENGSVAHVEISACGSSVCGVILRAYDSSGARVVSQADGQRLLWDMKAEGNGRYGSGRIWAPDQDKTYRSRMELSGANRLKVSGCVLGGAICRSQNWARVQ